MNAGRRPHTIRTMARSAAKRAGARARRPWAWLGPLALGVGGCTALIGLDDDYRRVGDSPAGSSGTGGKDGSASGGSAGLGAGGSGGGSGTAGDGGVGGSAALG